MELILNKDKYQNNLNKATHFINKKTDEFYDKLFHSIGK